MTLHHIIAGEKVKKKSWTKKQNHEELKQGNPQKIYENKKE